MSENAEMDDHHAFAAFSPAALTAGAILPREARAALTQDESLPLGTFEVEADGWVSPSIPVLVRGSAKILPLAWLGDESIFNPEVTPQDFSSFAVRMRHSGMYFAGPWRNLLGEESRTDSIGSYAEALRAAGATKADVWTYSESLGTALVTAGSAEAGTLSLALHVVPVAWVSERYATGPVSNIDLRWTWADVIALR